MSISVLPSTRTAAHGQPATTRSPDLDSVARDAALLAARLTVGVLIFGHGAQKLFGWFGGHGLKATGAGFADMGFSPGRIFAALAGTTEVVAGVLLVLGLLTPLAAAAVIGVMIDAIAIVGWQHGLFGQGGYEYPLLLAVVAAGLAFSGPGRFSLDRGQFSLDRGQRWSAGGLVPGLFSLALGLGSAVVILAIQAAG